MLEDIARLAQLLAKENVVIDSARTGKTIIQNNLIASSTVQAATIADTNETTLWTYTLPAGLLPPVGRTIRIHAYGDCAANGNTKTVKLYFGANSHTVLAGAANGVLWWTNYTLQSQSRTTQQRMGLGGFGGTVNAPSISAATEDLSTDIIIKITGTNGTAAANDITFRYVTVELI